MMSNNEQFHQAFFYLISGLFSAESIFFYSFGYFIFKQCFKKNQKYFVCLQV